VKFAVLIATVVSDLHSFHVVKKSFKKGNLMCVICLRYHQSFTDFWQCI